MFVYIPAQNTFETVTGSPQPDLGATVLLTTFQSQTKMGFQLQSLLEQLINGLRTEVVEPRITDNGEWRFCYYLASLHIMANKTNCN